MTSLWGCWWRASSCAMEFVWREGRDSASFRKTHCGCLPVSPWCRSRTLQLYRVTEVLWKVVLVRLDIVWCCIIVVWNVGPSVVSGQRVLMATCDELLNRWHFGVKVIVSQMTFAMCWDRFMGAVGWRWAQENRGSHTARSGQEPHTPGGTKCVLRVGGEPRKTAGPTLRGAARSRTLQEGPNVCCGLAVSPGKPRVPYCEERPGAAHSRRDQMCVVGWRKAQENRGSHTARSGQEPHTPGGTIFEATEFGMFHPPDVVDQATALCSSSPSTKGRLGVSGACAVCSRTMQRCVATWLVRCSGDPGQCFGIHTVPSRSSSCTSPPFPRRRDRCSRSTQASSWVSSRRERGRERVCPNRVHWSAALMGGVTFVWHRGSYTARSGWEPHTPGGTIFIVG